MGASISIPGLDTSNATPGVFIYVNFAAGPVAGSSAERTILVIANRSSAGTATTNTVVYGPDTDTPLQNEADMINLGGPGSEAHRIYRRITAVNTSTAVYWLFVTPSGGTAASGVITIAGGTATGSGNLRIWVGDEFVDTPIASGDTVTTIAAAAVLSVTNKTAWPVTAGNSAGVLTLTAKIAGPRGNQIRFMSAITTGITSTTSVVADTAMSSGATADSSTTALGTILSRAFYRIVSAAEDATQLGALVSQVNTQAAPTTGIRQTVFAGSVDTLSNSTTISTGINAPRCEIVWQEKSQWTAGELAGNMAAIAALFETAPNPKSNFAGFGSDANTAAFWKVPKSRVDSAAPTAAQIKSALNNGLSPIAVGPRGQTYLVNRVTTRSLSGSTQDYRIRDPHKRTICDYFSDDLAARTALQYSGKRLGDDPPKGGTQPGPDTVTPSGYRNCVVSLVNDYDENGLLQKVDAIKAGIVCQRSASVPTRLEVYIPLATVDILTQWGIEVAQVA